ncbi:metal-binding protein [Escherichia coli]|uniref:Metal-binding protein n=1 Tax=Escherichia coli TaxID=562 RepID=A0A2X1QCU6_ECOLX|nr:metal-binding protein [Escherichia coli]
MSPLQFEQSITLIQPAALALYQHWLSVRMSEASSRPVPVKGAEKLPGRNDPCQCGSGKNLKSAACTDKAEGGLLMAVNNLDRSRWYIGNVLWFGGYNSKTDRENNFGFLLSENGNELFFHKNEISRNYTPADNTPVLFRKVQVKMVSLRLLTFTCLIKQMRRRLSSSLNISGLLLRRALIRSLVLS